MKTNTSDIIAYYR